MYPLIHERCIGDKVTMKTQPRTKGPREVNYRDYFICTRAHDNIKYATFARTAFNTINYNTFAYIFNKSV